MPTQTKIPLIILVCVLAAGLLAGVVYFIFMHFWGAPENVLISTYLCPDTSYYVVIREEDRLFVAGSPFMRIEKSSRFSNGVSEAEIVGEEFTLRSGEETITCTAGIPESGSPPILN